MAFYIRSKDNNDLYLLEHNEMMEDPYHPGILDLPRFNKKSFSSESDANDVISSLNLELTCLVVEL